MAGRLLARFLFLLLALHKSDNSLFSRFRNPNEFVAPVDSMISDEVDHDIYENLMEEIPELRGHLKRQRSRYPLRMPYLKNNFEQSDEYDFMINGVDLDDGRNFTDAMSTLPPTSYWNAWNGTLNASSVTPSGAFHNISNSSEARRWYKWKGPKVATCYTCNLQYHLGIPISPTCHNAFESPNWRERTKARYFRAHCYYNRRWGSRIETKWILGGHRQTDRGLFRGYYGHYIGGCFKRFLDVGEVYTARGCRSYLPMESGWYAGRRFSRLELLLKGQKDACIVSPHASLTPFSRAISLYVRYHVCICQGKFCNSSAALAPCLLLYIVLLYLFL